MVSARTRGMVKKIVAVVAIVAAVLNLVLMAMGVIEPHVFMITVLFLFLLSYTYYNTEDTRR